MRKCRLGGAKSGVEEDVGAGDVMVIPAGVAHERSVTCCCLTHAGCPVIYAGSRGVECMSS